jgi:hypothetical protein
MQENVTIVKYDITKTNVPIEQPLQKTGNPFLLQSHRRHRHLELTLRLDLL